MTISNFPGGDWVDLTSGVVTLRCWCPPTVSVLDDTGDIVARKRVIIVLPQRFGVNGWVRSVAYRLAAAEVPALATPLFARTALGLDLSYSDQDLAEDRRHNHGTTADQILDGVCVVIASAACVLVGVSPLLSCWIRLRGGADLYLRSRRSPIP